MKQRGKFILFLALFLILTTLVQAGELKVTQEHPFLVDNQWIPASDLQVGDILKTADGKSVRITNIQDVETEGPFPVYNLEAGIYHNFVVGLDKLIVHNSNLPINGKDSFLITEEIRPDMLYTEVCTTSCKKLYWRDFIGPRRGPNLVDALGPDDFLPVYQEGADQFTRLNWNRFTGMSERLGNCIPQSEIRIIDTQTEMLINEMRRISSNPSTILEGPTPLISGKPINKIGGPAASGFRRKFYSAQFFAGRYGGSPDDYIKIGTPKELGVDYFYGTKQEIHWVLNTRTKMIIDPKIKPTSK